jgi:hypothetical protein
MSTLTVGQQKQLITHFEDTQQVDWLSIRNELPKAASPRLIVFVTARAQAAGPRLADGGVLGPVRAGEGVIAVNDGAPAAPPARGGAAARRDANAAAGEFLASPAVAICMISGHFVILVAGFAAHVLHGCLARLPSLMPCRHSEFVGAGPLDPLPDNVDWTVLSFATTAAQAAHPDSVVGKSELNYLSSGLGLRLGQTSAAGKKMPIGNVHHPGADIAVVDFFNAVHKHGGTAAVRSTSEPHAHPLDNSCACHALRLL